MLLYALACAASAFIARGYIVMRGEFVMGKLFNVTLPDRQC